MWVLIPWFRRIWYFKDYNQLGYVSFHLRLERLTPPVELVIYKLKCLVLRLIPSQFLFILLSRCKSIFNDLAQKTFNSLKKWFNHNSASENHISPIGVMWNLQGNTLHYLGFKDLNFSQVIEDLNNLQQNHY